MQHILAATFLSLGTFAAHAAVLPYATWLDFSFSGVGDTVSPSEGFTLTAAGPTLLRVTDGFLIGDVFRVSIDDGSGAVTFDTSAVLAGDSGEQAGGDPETVWADARVSKGSILLGAGIWEIDIEVLASPFGGGGAFIRADRAVPEPMTLALTGLGLAALGFARRKRKA